MRNIGKSLIVLAFTALATGSAMAAGPGHNVPVHAVVHNSHVVVHHPVAKRMAVHHHYRYQDRYRHQHQLSHQVRHHAPAVVVHAPLHVHR